MERAGNPDGRPAQSVEESLSRFQDVAQRRKNLRRRTPFFASPAFCIVLAENLWRELACRERLHGEQALAEVLGRQAPLAVEPAQKIAGRKVLLPRVAIQAGGDQVAVGILARLGARHHMIQAVGPARRPAQTVKTHAAFVVGVVIMMDVTVVSADLFASLPSRGQNKEATVMLLFRIFRSTFRG